MSANLGIRQAASMTSTATIVSSAAWEALDPATQTTFRSSQIVLAALNNARLSVLFVLAASAADFHIILRILNLTRVLRRTNTATLSTITSFQVQPSGAADYFTKIKFMFTLNPVCTK